MRGYTDKNGKPRIDWEGRDKKEFQNSFMSNLIRQLNHQYGVTYGIAKVTPEDEANKNTPGERQLQPGA